MTSKFWWFGSLLSSYKSITFGLSSKCVELGWVKRGKERQARQGNQGWQRPALQKDLHPIKSPSMKRTVWMQWEFSVLTRVNQNQSHMYQKDLHKLHAPFLRSCDTKVWRGNSLYAKRTYTGYTATSSYGSIYQKELHGLHAHFLQASWIQKMSYIAKQNALLIHRFE